MPVVSMPKLSDTMTDGVLIKWLKQDGDQVQISDVIAEVETDKATMEMEAFDEGTLTIYAKEGTKVPVGGPIAFIAGEAEQAPASPGAPAPSKPAAQPPETLSTAPTAQPEPAPPSPPTEAAPPSTAPAAAPAPAPPAAAAPTPAPGTGPAAAPDGKVKASPVALKMAAARGIDPAKLTGSGPGGRIVKRDVLAAAGELSAPTTPSSPSTSAVPKPVSPAPAPAPDSPPAALSGADTRVPLSGMRATIAQRLLESKTRIPHFYLHVELDAAPLMDLRKQLNAAAAAANASSNKYTVNDFILKAAVGAAAAVPRVNASFAGDAIVQFASIHLAVAVAIEDGLVTPVIRDAQKKTLLEISMAVKDLAERARNKRLSPDEFQGGTLTVSNLGAYGIEAFDAIINPPQAAILSVGAIVAKPVVDASGAIAPGQRMDIGMSCDHRVVDGAIGAQYLAEFKKIIENPALMLI